MIGMQQESIGLRLCNTVKSFFNWILKLRYIIAIVVFIALVLLKINGSNIGFWKNYIDTSGQNSIVFGHAEGVRSDEYEVLMPIYLSQQNSDTPFSVINPDITTSGHNVVITLDAPVKDIYSIAKPLHWGFLFLNADYAISWYWDMKFLLILLLGYELCMILTRRNKVISVLGSLWIVLSPAVQWWFAQHVGDNTLYMMAIVVTFYYFLKFFDRLPLKILFAFLFSLSCLGFLVPLYPPVQIPFGFLALLLMILIFLDFRKRIEIRKLDIVIVGAAAVFTLLMALHLYTIIKGALPLMSHTVYPGQRVSTGGNTPPFDLYTYLTNFWLPYKGMSIPNENASELSSFYNFLPAVLLALPIMIRRRRDGSLRYGAALAIFSVFFALFTAFSFVPPIIAKITLLSYVTGARAVLAYTFSAMLLSIWALAYLWRSGPVNRIYSVIATAVIALSYFVTVEYGGIKGDIRLRYYLAFILLLALLNYLLLRGKRWAFAIFMVPVIVLSGATINPVNIGAGDLLSANISKEIQAVDKSDPGAVWAGMDVNTNISCALNILIYANGGRTLGGINNYPDYTKWAPLDPDRLSADIYNRSSHVSLMVVNTPTTFTLLGNNSFNVNVNINDLKKMKVKYIVSGDDMPKLNTGDVQFVPLYKQDARYDTVYKVEYK